MWNALMSLVAKFALDTPLSVVSTGKLAYWTAFERDAGAAPSYQYIFESDTFESEVTLERDAKLAAKRVGLSTLTKSPSSVVQVDRLDKLPSEVRHWGNTCDVTTDVSPRMYVLYSNETLAIRSARIDVMSEETFSTPVYSVFDNEAIIACWYYSNHDMEKKKALHLTLWPHTQHL